MNNTKVLCLLTLVIGLISFTGLSGLQAQTYKVDNSFSGTALTNVVYLATMSDNSLCGLKSDGTVVLVQADGTVSKEFKTPLADGKVIAVDDKDNIYVLGSDPDAKSAVSARAPRPVKCVRMDKNGKVQHEMVIADLSRPSGMKVHKGQLYVADPGKRGINIIDAKTGQLIKNVDKLRSCCGILDFDITPSDEIILAHLGAFKVEYLNMEGTSLRGFGERGADLSQFHGCCNPVSVGHLSGGGVVTVEKDPTRIKVYNDKQEATLIEGVTELVKGCSYIPVAIDKKDNIYLASPRQGIIRCVASK